MHLLHQVEVATLLGIPDTYVQGCLLPVAKLRSETAFVPAPRRSLEEVVVVDHWDGPSISTPGAEEN
jgi:hypothetical protein